MSILNFPVSRAHPEQNLRRNIASQLPEPRTALFVLGMHRSGTSVMARVLGLCGAALPKHTIPDSEKSNPLGHWEPLHIVETHDRFLQDAGTGWDEMGEYPEDIFRSELARFYQNRLMNIVRKEYGDAQIFVLKDPRTSRLMRLWRPILTKLKVRPQIVITVRNPLEVADSLRNRDGWDEHRALVVWMRYMLSAERSTRDLSRCFIKYDQLLSDWRTVIQKISDQLGTSLLRRKPATDAKIDKFIRKDLRHNSRSDAELQHRLDIADCVKRAYQCFSVAADGGRIDYTALDAIAEALDAAENMLHGNNLMSGQDRGNVVTIDMPHPAERDALFALALAELGLAHDNAKQARSRLEAVISSRSWRLIGIFQTIFRYVRLARWPALIKAGQAQN